MSENELDEFLKLNLEDLQKMNLITQMESRIKHERIYSENFEREYLQKDRNMKHIIYAAIISGSLIGVATIIATVIQS